MKTLNEQAYEHLSKMIIENKLSYQEIYSETKLSKEIGISRTPFRDAVHRLAQEGYIDIIPSKGFRLHQLSEQDVINTFQIRSALECYCCYEITRDYQSDAAQALFQNLESATKKMKEIMETTHSIVKFSEYDFDFHIQIIHYLKNEQLISIYNTFFYRMKKLATLSLSHEGRMEQTYQEHRNILVAMKDGDLEHIYEITMEHMNTPRRINLEDLVG